MTNKNSTTITIFTILKLVSRDSSLSLTNIMKIKIRILAIIKYKTPKSMTKINFKVKPYLMVAINSKHLVRIPIIMDIKVINHIAKYIIAVLLIIAIMTSLIALMMITLIEMISTAIRLKEK